MSSAISLNLDQSKILLSANGLIIEDALRIIISDSVNRSSQENNSIIQVTLDGIPKNPEEQDDYMKHKGSIPKFNSEYGCIQDVVGYSVNETALGKVVFMFFFMCF